MNAFRSSRAPASLRPATWGLLLGLGLFSLNYSTRLAFAVDEVPAGLTECEGDLRPHVLGQTALNPLSPGLNGSFKDQGLGLRRATEKDSGEIQAFIEACRREMGVNPGVSADGRSLFSDFDAFSHRFDGRFGEFLILENADHRLAATVSLQYSRLGVTELRRFYLRSDLRGKGLGERWLRVALKRAWALGYGKVELQTDTINMDAAARMYERAGFERTSVNGTAAYYSRALP